MKRLLQSLSPGSLKPHDRLFGYHQKLNGSTPLKRVASQRTNWRLPFIVNKPVLVGAAVVSAVISLTAPHQSCHLVPMHLACMICKVMSGSGRKIAGTLITSKPLRQHSQESQGIVYEECNAVEHGFHRLQNSALATEPVMMPLYVIVIMVLG